MNGGSCIDSGHRTVVLVPGTLQIVLRVGM